MTQLDRIEDKLDRVFENHLPHIERRLSRLQGQAGLILLLISGSGVGAFLSVWFTQT